MCPLTPIDTKPAHFDFATDPNADVDPDANLEPDPDSERLVPYEPGYVDGKGPLHEAAISRILTPTPGTFRQRIATLLPTLCLRQILAAIPARPR